MTLKELRSRFLEEIQDFQPGVIPDQNGLINESVRDFLNRLGGIFRTATITTSSGEREYGTSAGFPTDFLKEETVWRNTIRLTRISRRERNESSSNGTPSCYYITRNRKIGFNVPCSASVGNINLYYFGKGDDLSNDSDVALGDLCIVDDDSLWDAITNYAALKYYRKSLANAFNSRDKELMAITKSMINDKKLEYLENKSSAIRTIRGHNSDKMMSRKLPEHYFGQDLHTFAERASNEGDVTRQW